jgi:hypothetical protein
MLMLIAIMALGNRQTNDEILQVCCWPAFKSFSSLDAVDEYPKTEQGHIAGGSQGHSSMEERFCILSSRAEDDIRFHLADMSVSKKKLPKYQSLRSK